MVYARSEGEVKSIFTATRPLSTAAVYSDGINIERGGYFGLWLSANPASALSAAQLCVWYDMSWDNTAAHYVYGGSILANTNGLSGVASGVSIAPFPMPWMRIGLSATSSSVTTDAGVTVKLFEQ